MPRRRKTLAELEMSGQLAKNGKRYKDRALPPLQNGFVGEPHSSLNEEQRAIWVELADAAPVGLLQRSDRTALEIACRLLSIARTGRARPSEVTILTTLLGKLGFNPVDRARITLPPPPREEDEFDRLMREQERILARR